VWKPGDHHGSCLPCSTSPLLAQALNDELNIAFRDPGLVAELETHFLADLEDTRELNLAAWRARPLAMRGRELASALMRREL
jgi:phosphatidylserine/phosphatidylglycerophosphate/cardiolipin synthase-like enzyme